TDLRVSRKDNVDAGGQNTAQLATGDYVLNITEASPHRLVFLQTAAGKTVQGMSQAHIALKSYNRDFAIEAPTKVVDLDDPATSSYLALRRQEPLVSEGEAGVGKTEAAKVMAEVLGARLIRLQCYEGIDLADAVYEWNYPRQLLQSRLMGEGGGERGDKTDW